MRRSMLIAARRSNAVLEYRVTAVQTNNAATFTFNSVDIGADAPGRLVVLGVVYDKNNTAGIQINSVTVQALAATEIVKAATGSGATAGAGVYQRTGLTGTTASVVVTLSATANNCALVVWTLNKYASTTAVFDSASALSATVLATDMQNAGVGVSILCMGSTTNRTATWTGMTELVDSPIETGEATYSAAQEVDGAIGLLSVTTTPSGTVNRQVLVSAAWI